MSMGLRAVKQRIKSVRNTQQITKAMKMVAAARIKKVETRMKAARPYAYKLTEVLQELTACLDPGETYHPLMEVRSPVRIGLVVISADKGLCGSYNSNLLRLLGQTLKDIAAAPSQRGSSDPPPASTRLAVLGNKAKRFLHKRGLEGRPEWVNWRPDADVAARLGEIVSDWYITKQVDEVRVIYTTMVSAVAQKPAVMRLLPISPPPAAAKQAPVPYMFEPSPEVAMGVIVPRYLAVVLQQILVESKAAELGARLRAMANATDNADKLAGDLTLQFFRARQEAITREIIEVSSGAEAAAG